MQLGMPFGTANSRLDRKILFWLIQKNGLDSCHRCRHKIERVEELSIEHKEPWQDVNPALFWDLNNIAFSHRSCNYRAGRKVIPKNSRYINAPFGMAWCGRHKSYLPIENFQKDKGNKNGLESRCKDCCRRFGGKGSYGH